MPVSENAQLWQLLVIANGVTEPAICIQPL